ncbi:MAG: hypothetical protein GF403_10805 [Candidatus Coatesbacteria bacterium]|nr:hypothetical protein [Candidatus Coatesbacteria bacterium]
MIELTHPWLLWALPAVLAPLLVYWWRRRLRRRRRFPALKLVREAAAEQSRRLRLRELLLTLLRMLALAAVILAAAGPLYLPESAVAPKRTLVLLDRSLSMSVEDEVDHSRWERAVEALAAWLRGLPETAVVDLVAFDAAPRPIVAGAYPGAALQALGRQEVGVGGSDVRGALEYAAALIGEEATLTLLLSDLPRPDNPEGLDYPGRLRLVPVGGAVNNGGVEELSPVNPLPLAGVPLELRASVSGPSRRYELVADGRVLERRELSGAGSLTLNAEGSGWSALVLEAEERDALAADDARRLVLRLPEPPRVYPATSVPALDLLLRSSPGLAETVGSAQAAEVVVVVYPRLDALTANADALILVPAERPVSMPELGLELLTPAVSGGEDRTLGLVAPPGGDNPITSALGGAAGILERGGLVRRAPRVRLDENWRVLLEYGNGSPALALREEDGRRLMLWLMPYRAADGALPVSELWAPLMLQTLRLTAHGETPTSVRTGGDTLRLEPGQWLIDPLGERRQAVGGGVELDLLGFWRLGDADDPQGRPLAINAPPGEGRLGEPAVEEYRTLIGDGVEVVELDELAASAGSAPLPLWRWLLILAALLLTTELILALGRRRG